MTGHATVAELADGFAGGVAFVRRAGSADAAPLVLLHGIGSNAASFTDLAAALPPGLDVIAWNAPGYGGSTPLGVAMPTPRHYAEALARFLDALEMPRVALAGHSLGALFAGSFAARYPDRVHALALISPALGYGVEPGEDLPAVVRSRIEEIDELGPAAFAKKRAARLVGDPEAQPHVVAAVERAMAAVHPGGYVQAVHALGSGRLLSDAGLIRAPALVAVGSLDRITPPANAGALHAALPRAIGFHQIAGAGHALPQEQPDALAFLLAPIAETMAHV